MEIYINDNGFENIRLSNKENKKLEHCHNIIEDRFMRKGVLYTDSLKERCEWCLLGILRFNGIEKMIDVAKNMSLDI